ncbi:MAG: helix-turn-helix transcriptional regulator [Clostridiales bacterium]|nr:helix-turn-helix transcriptional regulator [Clostridiales bacterium]
MLLMQVIIKLREIRIEKNISIRELSRKTGISKSHLNYIENGEREPTISVIVRIALALGIDEKDLYEVKK